MIRVHKKYFTKKIALGYIVIINKSTKISYDALLTIFQEFPKPEREVTPSGAHWVLAAGRH